MYVEDLDFTAEYLESGFSTFTLEDSIRYLKEFRLGDKVSPSFYLNNANKKLLSSAIIDRLTLNKDRIDSITKSIDDVDGGE